MSYEAKKRLNRKRRKGTTYRKERDSRAPIPPPPRNPHKVGGVDIRRIVGGHTGTRFVDRW
jgi:hypothetical protein